MLLGKVVFIFLCFCLVIGLCYIYSKVDDLLDNK